MSLIGNANLLTSLCVAPLKRAGHPPELLDQVQALITDHMIKKALAVAGGDVDLASGLLLKAAGAVSEAVATGRDFSVSSDLMAKAKTSKAAVCYVSPSRSNEHCEDCTMFLPLIGACTAVEGSISPDGWCRLFDPKSEGE